MKTVSDYQAKGVVFVEGDVVRHSEQQDMRMAIDGCNRGQCGQSVVESFAWRTITGAVPQHGLDGNMLVEIAFYNNHRSNGVKQIPACDVQWGQPTVHKAWRPTVPAQQPEQAQQPQLTVHVGAELYWNGDLVEVMAISNGTVCVKQEDGELDLVQDANNLKSAEHHERVTDLCHVLRTSHDTVTDACTALGQYKTYAEAILKAGYRKG